MVHVIVMVTVTAVALGVRYYLQLVAPGAIMSQFPFYALPFVAWYPFYHLGFFIRTRETVRAKWVLVLLIGYGLFLVCSFLEGRALIQAGATEMAGSQIRISSFLMSLMLFMWVITRMPRENSGAKVLIWLGRNSFFIYLSHLLIMSMTVRLLDLVEFGNAPGVARTVVLAGATLLACVVIGLVLQRLLPGQIAVNFLGLDRSRMGLRRAGRAIALPPR
jgi:fucose 4-O-acetylase-like acetyltransferase